MQMNKRRVVGSLIVLLALAVLIEVAPGPEPRFVRWSGGDFRIGLPEFKEAITTGQTFAPIYTAAHHNIGEAVMIHDMLTADASATLVGTFNKDQLICFVITQDSRGGWKYKYPSNVRGFNQPAIEAGAITSQCGIYDGKRVNAVTPSIVSGDETVQKAAHARWEAR